MAVLTVKDMNGKEFNVNTDTISCISGDIVEDKKNGNAVTDSYRQNRVKQVREIAFLDAKGNPVDNIKLLSDLKNGVSDIIALDIETEATHSGKNHNFVIYYEDSMEKDAESFINPFHKPMLKNHNQYNGEPLGRVRQAYHGESTLTDERTAIHLKIRVTDSSSFEKFLDGRYQTVSIGGSMNTVTCNICGKNILKDGKFKFCGHWRGETYKDQVCYWGARDIEYHEVSVVNNPADDFAQIMKVTVLTSSDENNNTNNNNKEENQMAAQNTGSTAADAAKKSICELIDNMLGAQAAPVVQPEASAQDNNSGGGVSSQDSGTGPDSNGQASDDAVQKLNDQITELQKQNKELADKLADSEKKLQQAEADRQALQATCDSYKEKCVALAEANKNMTVDAYVAKEIAVGAIKEDAADARREELRKMSMKEIDALEAPKAPETPKAEPREQASVTSPVLSENDSNEAGSKSSAPEAGTTDKAKTVDDFANDIVSKLLNK